MDQTALVGSRVGLGTGGRIERGLLVVLALTGAACARFADAAEAPARHLPPPDHIASETMRDLKARMGRHGNTMSNLVRAVVLLDRPGIQALARNIADEEIVASTVNGAKSDKPLPLPREFGREQDALRVAAQQLAVAAVAGGDDNALADAFATVTRTCVACHSSYLHGDFRPEAPAKTGIDHSAKP
jgi:cytochrome c556